MGRQPPVPRVAVLAAALMIMFTLPSCTGGPAGPPAHPGRAPQPTIRTTRTTGPAATSFPAPAADAVDVPVGDQVDQRLTTVAAGGLTVVAVGRDGSANRSRPLFVRSVDGGRSWLRAAVDPATEDPAGADESAWQVAHGPGGFIAIGDNGDQLLSWHSADGGSWRRSPIAKTAVRNGDVIDDLVGTDHGFTMVGHAAGRHGRLLGSLLTWTSPDGHHWQRHQLPTSVLAGEVGIPSAVRLVVGPDEMIMAGDLQNSADGRQPNRILILRSTDDGSTWTKINTPPDLAGDFRAYARDLIRVDGRYLLLADGDGADRGNSWDSVILSGGAHGTAWHPIAAPQALGSTADDYGEVLLPVPAPGGTGRQHTWLVAGSIGKTPSDGLIAVGDDLDHLRRLHADALVGARSQSVSDGVLSDGAAILVGSDGRTGSDDPMILRVDGTTVSRVEPRDLGGKPVPEVAAMIAAGNGFRAVGELNGTPLLWNSSDGLRWRPSVLPARGQDGVIEARADAVAAGPDGTAIAIGTLTRNRGRRLGVWSIDRDGRPRRLTSAAFVSPVPDDYGYLDATAITHGAGGWVITANHVGNGRCDIWLLHSDDGRHWTKGRGTVRGRRSSDEVRDHRTVWSSFRAPPNGQILTSGVVAVGRGFVVTGTSYDGVTARPVAWRSDDGVTWSRPEQLPLPPGVSDVAVANAIGSDGRVIATGWTNGKVADDRLARLSWRLDLHGPPASDTAAHWRVGPAAPGASSVESVLPIPGGFLGVGRAIIDGADDARWWRSRDGLTWTPLRLPPDRTSGPGEQRIAKVLPDGDGLLLWGWDVPPTGGGDYTVRVGMPR